MHPRRHYSLLFLLFLLTTPRFLPAQSCVQIPILRGDWFGGDGGPASLAKIAPSQVIFGNDGSMYLLEPSNRRVRRIDPAGNITTVAGNGLRADSGDGGPASQASFLNPTYIVLDSQQRLVIADPDAFRVRRVEPDGTIRTIAGTGIYGWNQEAGVATETNLYGPSALAADPYGNVYIFDLYRFLILSADGLLKTGFTPRVNTPGESTFVKFMTWEPRGSILFTGYSASRWFPDTGRVDLVSSNRIGNPDGQPAIRGAALADIIGIDSQERILFPEENQIRYIDRDGILGTLGPLPWGGKTVYGVGGSIFLGPRDTLYGLSYYLQLQRLSYSAAPVTVAGLRFDYTQNWDGLRAADITVSNLTSFAISPKTNEVYFTDQSAPRIWRIDSSGIVRAAAGNGTVGPITASPDPRQTSIYPTIQLRPDPAGNILLADTLPASNQFPPRTSGIWALSDSSQPLQQVAAALTQGSYSDFAADSRTFFFGNQFLDRAQPLGAPLTPLPNTDGFFPSRLVTGLDGSVYAVLNPSSSSYQLARLDRDGPRRLPYLVTSYSPFAGIGPIAADRSGGVYVSTRSSYSESNGFSYRALDYVNPTGTSTPLPVTPPIKLLALDSAGALYVHSDGNLLRIPDPQACVRAAEPAPEPLALVNTASYLDPDVISSREIVTVFGNHLGPIGGTKPSFFGPDQGIPELGGTRTSLGSVLYADEHQVIIAIPTEDFRPAFALATTLTITRNGRSATLPRPLLYVPSTPAAFTADGSGQGAIAAINFDGTTNSPANPATTGFTMYLNGIPRTQLPRIFIGGIEANYDSVTRSNLRPREVRVRVPVNSPKGDRVAVVVKSEDATSAQKLWVSIR